MTVARSRSSSRTTNLPTIELPNGWTPRKYQRPLWSALQGGKVKRFIEIAHRRWGKDDVFLHNACIEAHKRPATYWHCLPEYEQGRKAVWDAVNPHTGKRRIDEAFPEALRDSKDEQKMFIRLKCGSTWQLVGSDRYNSLVGSGVAGITFSEWALCNPSSWGYIRPMIEENNGWAGFITTPRGQNHAKRMYDMAVNNPLWFAEISSVYDTHALSQEQLTEAQNEYITLYGEDLGLAQFQQEYECSFTAAIMGAFYAKEMVNVRNSGRIRDFEYVEGIPVHRAWDIGVRDSTAIWWFQVVGNKLLILDYYESNTSSVLHFAHVIEDKNTEYGWVEGHDYVPHDIRVKEWGTIDSEVPRSRIESMKRVGLKPKPPVARSTDADGHQAIRNTLPHCTFHTRTEDGIACLENYRREWDDELKTFRASALHDWAAHGAKAFQYLSQAWHRVKEEEKSEKPRHTEVGPGNTLTLDDAWGTASNGTGGRI